MTNLVGKPLSRVDGRAKVTGQAQYAADFGSDGVLHVVLFESTIACGTIRSFDLDEARAVPGVVDILTFQNAMKLKKPKNIIGGAKGEGFMPLQSNEIFYNGQFIGAVIAETLEAAQESARRIKVAYNEKPAKLDFDNLLKEAYDPGRQYYQKVSKKRGDAEAALAKAEVVVSNRWLMPTEHHNPMEAAAVTVSLEGDTLVVHDSTQAVVGTAQQYAKVLGLKPENVHLTSKFIGGAFGCKGPFWAHQAIAGMAAMMTKRPIKLVLTRQQMFNGVGHRARTIQDIVLGANRDGQLQGIRHIAHNATAMTIDYCEDPGGGTSLLYACDNVEVKQMVVKLNYMTAGSMRAPGHASGSYAFESAMDELAEQLDMDPIALRLKNHADIDPERKRPFTSKSLRECYAKGASAFGWNNRPSKPRTRREGDWWVGYGMASATYPAMRVNAKASARLLANGYAEVRSATQDLGTGTYTIMTQIAADELGLPMDHVDFDLGDNRFPPSGVSGGSTGAASAGSAVALACQAVRAKLAKLAVGDARSPLNGLDVKQLRFEEGTVQSLEDPSRSESYAALITRNGGKPIEGDGKVGVYDVIKGVMFSDSGHAFGAQFVEVRVHATTGEVRVHRMTSAFGCGRILNPMTATSQIAGGMVWGVGQALMEETVEDLRTGRLAVRDLADYHVPVQADIPEIDVIFIDEKDEKINPLGIKGVGEIGICGVAGAIANAVYNAVGVRVRELPITSDKIIQHLAAPT
jgi:xanthine dehydrogenase YagR molybdenum-binding subunit